MPEMMMTEQGDTMFLENANLQHARRHHELFLRSRPYRGELPTVAGLLLYPDTPAKMETTSREAFCFRRSSHPDRGHGRGERSSPDTLDAHHRSHLTSSKQTGRGSREQEPGTARHQTAPPEVKEEMKSQYQKDFLAPSSGCRRTTPALPQPDNIGINPAFRMDFNTVQRQTYPRWTSTSRSSSTN